MFYPVDFVDFAVHGTILLFILFFESIENIGKKANF
jgi:hypothetical protein